MTDRRWRSAVAIAVVGVGIGGCHVGDSDTDGSVGPEGCAITVAGGPGRATCWSEGFGQGPGTLVSYGAGELVSQNAVSFCGSGGEVPCAWEYATVVDVAGDGGMRVRGAIASQPGWTGTGDSVAFTRDGAAVFVSTDGVFGMHPRVARFDRLDGGQRFEDAASTLEPPAPLSFGGNLVIGGFGAAGVAALAVDYDGGADWNPEAGQVFVVPLDLVGDVQVADVATAHLFSTQPLDGAGRGLAGGGDVDGDGLEDLLIGAPNGDPQGGGRGTVYVAKGPFVGDVPLDDASGVWLGEASGDHAGGVVLSPDLNGDGYDDLVVTAVSSPTTPTGARRVYVVHGPATGAHSLVEADAWFDVDGPGAIAAVGDFSGDGFPDVAVGLAGDQSGVPRAGRVLLFDGRAAGVLSVEGAVVIASNTVGDATGTSIAALGDIDGDGFDDLAIGAPYSDRDGDRSGAIYLVFGQAP